MSLANVIAALRAAPRQVDDALLVSLLDQPDAFAREHATVACFSGLLLDKMVAALEQVERERAELSQQLAIARAVHLQTTIPLGEYDVRCNVHPEHAYSQRVLLGMVQYPTCGACGARATFTARAPR